MASGNSVTSLREARGASHCHHCFKGLMYFKGALAFKEVIHPDGHHVRVHHACWELILGDGYKPLPGDTSRYLGAFRRAPNWRD